MDRLVLAKVLAITALAGVGVVAPAAVWVVHHPTELDAKRSTQVVSFGDDWTIAPRPAIPKVTLMQLEPIVIAVRAKQERAHLGAVDVFRPEGERTCHVQASETFAGGRIRVCDGDRTEVKRGSGVFGAIDKRTRLAPRDLRSPSGILEEQ